MKLNDYYGYLNDVKAGIVPRSLANEMMANWLPRYNRGQLSPAWSQEWANYDQVAEWIYPWSGWLVDAFAYERNRIGRGIIQAYRMLGTKGEIVPVAYRVVPPGKYKENEQVLIRISKRLYIVFVPIIVSDTIGIIALPVDFEDAFDAAMLRGFCTNGANWLQHWRGESKSYGFGRYVETAGDAFNFMEKHPQALSSVGPNPEEWSNLEWESLSRMINKFGI